MYDVIVVGARCAGASSALLLARAGHRVLLVDRMHFPSDTMSTLYIHQPGIRLLDDWGILEAVRASGCPPLDRTEYRIGDVVLAGPAASVDGCAAAYAPRRHILDRLLVEAAVEAGVEFVDRAGVTEVCFDDGRVTGLRFRGPEGRETEVRCRLLVGADGMNSKVARLVQAPYEVVDERMTCVYFTAWQGVRSGFAFHEQLGHWIAVIPTHDDTTIVSTYFPQARFDEIRRAPLESHLTAIRSQAPDVHAKLAAAQRLGPVRGTGDQRNFFRRAYGPGWALVGDAGLHLDTITARGITNAFQQASLLAESVAGLIGDPIRLEAGLREWSARRDAALKPGYASALALARLDPAPSRVRLMKVIAADPRLTQRFFAVVAGILPMADLLTDEVLDLL